MKTSPFHSWPYADAYTLQPMTHKQTGNWLKGKVLVDSREYETKGDELYYKFDRQK